MIVAVGLARTAARCNRDIDDVLPLFDPDGTSAFGLDLIQTPRDAKRAVNALAAALPLTDDSYAACLDLLLRLFVPALDGPRLDGCRHLREPATRQQLLAELESGIRAHRRAGAAREALRGLFQATEKPPETP